MTRLRMFTSMLPPEMTQTTFFALNGQLVEEGGCHGHCTGPLGDELLVLHQGEDGGCRFILGHGHDVVHILLAELVSQLTGGLDLDAVREGGGSGEGLVFVLMEGAVLLGAPSA